MTSGSTSRLSDVLSTLNPLRRRTSLHGSIRSIASSVGSTNSKDNNKSRGRRSSTYYSYSVYSQTMFFPILRDPEATNKLLEAILDSPGGKRSLSRLARTCRALSELALNVLWRDLDSPIPLIGLFPSTMMKKPRKPALGLTKVPDEEDWGKLMKYGERVRSITYNESSSSLSPSVFPMLEQNRPRKYMLPNLQQLSWKAETAASLDYCSLFLNSELETLQLELAAASRFPALNRILADVASRMNLKTFSFISPVSLPDSFVELMAPQEALQKVVLVAPGAFSPTVGRWIASLPELKSLQLDMSGRTSVAVEGFFDEMPSHSGDSTPSSVGTTDSGVFSGDELDFSEIRKSSLRLTGDLKPKRAFANLRQLHLTGDASNIAVFLKHFASPLAQLDLVIDDPPVSADWMELSYMICERFGPSLQSLRISATGTSRFNDLLRSTPRAGPPSGRLSLEHLSLLPALSRLEVDLPESIHFTAADIVQLASSCPNLEELRLCPLARFPVQTGPPKLTLAELAPLTAQCRRLHTLAVTINARGGAPELLSLRSASSDSLRRLHVGHSWVHDSLHVAILLSHLAPYLETLKWFHEKNRPGYIETNARGWEKVSEALPHLQSIRLTERRSSTPEPLVIREEPPPVETAEKSVDATVLLLHQGVLVKPHMAERSTQFSGPRLVNRSVGVHIESISVGVDAIPQVAEASAQVTVAVADESVQVLPLTASASVDATVPSVSKSVEALLLKPSNTIIQPSGFRYSSYLIPTPIANLMAFTCRILIAYPMSIPFRILHAAFEHMPKIRRTPGEKEVDVSSPDRDISMDTLQDNSDSKKTDSLDVHETHGRREHEQKAQDKEDGSKELSEVQVRFWFPQRDYVSNSATRHFHLNPLLSTTSSMSDNKKQEKDFTPEVDALLPEAESLIKAGKQQEALDKLFALEKQTRNAADPKSTTRLVKAITEHCYNKRDFTQLNSSISLLSKKHGQLKAVIQAMVEQVMGWLEDIRKKEGTERWLQLVETLREVTEGKIFLETPRARVTLLLSRYHEDLYNNTTSPEEKRKSLETASELLSDLQVETYSSMERREKTEFILEQMRLLIAVARSKDEVTKAEGKDSLAGGEAEWAKVRVGGRKVNEEFLKEKENEDLKLKYYDLMIQHALHHSSYLDVAKYYHKVWETPSIKEDVNDKGKAALEHIIYYIVLAPHDNEQSDMLNRIFINPALEKLQLHYNLVKCFTTQELMRWPGIVQLYGEFLRATPVFSIEKRWEDLHTRVIEHNVRVVAAYYTRITISRLTSLLDLDRKQTEETLARLVVSKTIWARIDRPAEIVNFRSQRSAEDVMNDWSSDMQKLLGLVEKTWMGMNAAQAAQSRIKASAS